MSPFPAIQPAVDGDGPGIARLIETVFAEYEDCPFLMEEFPELAAPATAFARKGGRLWVAREGGRIVGCLATAPTHQAGTWELFKVYVDASLRGNGLSAAMLAAALDHVRQAGGTGVVLWSDTRFTRGHAFYRKHGFRQLPGLRALHDVGRTLEFGFARAVERA
jgi:putative acetyltransferase